MKVIGTQVLPSYLVEQGIDPVLRDMQSRARINTIFVFSHTYNLYQYQYRTHNGAETDPADYGPLVWVKSNEAHYANTALRHNQALYYGKDLLDELREPCAALGITCYPRILEPYMFNNAVLGMEDMQQIGADNQPDGTFCYNNQPYREWWAAWITDLIHEHPYIPGIQLGHERGGPLTLLLLGKAPGCFCEYCQAKAAQSGIDVQQAHEGMRALHDFMQQVKAASGSATALRQVASDGVACAFWRICTRYPAILAWERFWYQSKEDFRREQYHLIHAIDPQLKVGWHIVHGHAWDFLFRAQFEFAYTPEYSDWIKPVMYSDCAGGRALGHFNKCISGGILADVDPETAFRLFYQLQGLDPDRQPTLDELEQKETTALDPDYVYRETRRITSAVNGRIPVYAGLGFDVGRTDPNRKYQDVDAQHVRQTIVNAFRGGADGIVIPREYHEARPELLAVVGKTLDQM